MTINLLFYHEYDTSVENQWTMIDQWVGMFNMGTLVIDRTGDFTHVTNIYATLDEAWADPKWRNYTWVYLDANPSKPFMDTYTHPTTDVIYCVGSDDVGYDGKTLRELNGPILTLRAWQAGRNYFAASIVPLICYDAWLLTQGRRKA